MKKRVYELARDYGMKGADLVRILKENGFNKAKTHMAVLDDADLLQVQAMLEVRGYVQESHDDDLSEAAQETASPLGPEGFTLIKRSKPKVSPVEQPVAPPASHEDDEEFHGGEDEESGAESEFFDDRHATPGRGADLAAGPLRRTEEAPEAGESDRESEDSYERDEEFSLADEPPSPHAGASVAAEEDDRLVLSEPGAEAPTEELEAGADETAEEPYLHLDLNSPERKIAAARQGLGGTAGEELEGGEESEEGKAAGSRGQFLAPRPSTPKRQAKILGKIDLGSLPQPTRQATGGPNYLSEPRPTMGRDRKSMFVRGAGGGGVRDAMSSQQLRERERSRVQRRSKPVVKAKGGRGRQRSGGDDLGAGGSRPDHAVVEMPINAKSLSQAIGIKMNELIMLMMRSYGKLVQPNQTLDEETAVLVAADFGVELEVKREVEAEEALLSELRATSESGEDTEPRPPVIAFLGHVDHGKTSLLDAVRKSRVVEGEAGGITQHIGAYQVTTPNGDLLTILDTPGHEAFTAMRARGANTTDIVVLVVAADDGVMPQTEEAIQHARAAEVPIVVAMNKIDRPEANPDRVLQQLSGLGLQAEEWGGDTQVVRTSAVKGTGIQELLEAINLQASINLELRSNPEANATGTVLEAEVSEGRGIVAHLLVQNGTLTRGDVILAGEGFGKVRAIYNDRGEEIESAGPSTPVEVIGLSALPAASDSFYVVDDLAKAREVAEQRAQRVREMQLAERAAPRRTLADLLSAQSTGEEQQKELKIVLRADVQGSIEALRKSLGELSTEAIRVDLLQVGVGAITESDVNLAAASDAVILGFHVSTDDKARQAAEKLGVEIRTYHVIYELLDDVRAAMEDRLSPILREEVVGKAEIRQVFTFSKVGKIAGCMVTSGTIKRALPIRLYRDGVVIYTGKLSTLRRVKEDVREVRDGFECGLTIENYDDIKIGDVIEAYQVSQERRTL